MIKKAAFTLILIFLIIGGCTTVERVIDQQDDKDYEALYGPASPKQRNLTPEELKQSHQQGDISYNKDIKPILESRCAVCHGCYDAPCQLKMTSFEGLDRGATKQIVYDGKREEAVTPTRLFIDAENTADWREKKFYSVLNERIGTDVANLDNSVLAKLLQLKRINPLPVKGKLSDTFNFDINRTLECPSIDEFSEYQQEHPLWGMPYAMPGLSLKEEYTVLQWLQHGAKVEPRPAMSPPAAQAIAKWESFFNGDTLKQQLVSRYIYEHLFIGQIHFKNHPDNEFYKLVRSTTPPGMPIQEIATVRPYDKPGTDKIYYRLRPIVSTIVDKIRFIYEFSDQRMQRYRKLFMEPDYTVSELPSYQAETASNPFVTYSEIPRSSRYKFLLDDAGYFIAGFIKGPVCRGQIALSVIRDRFWVVFFDPEMDEKLKITGRVNAFLNEEKLTLEMPGADADEIGLFDYRKYDDLAEKYLKKKDKFTNQIISSTGGFEYADIWDGEEKNQNAALTVFRHFDSATVVKGLVGDTPLSAWVIDYENLERIHYLLVASFNVYGSVPHQLATRTYMDYLRLDAENNFLRFMPDNQRETIHNSWYQGISGRLAKYLYTPYYSTGYETAVQFKTSNYQKEFFDQIKLRMGKAADSSYAMNPCSLEACKGSEGSGVKTDVDNTLHKLSKLKGKELDLLPEVSFLRIKTGLPGGDYVYTLLLNKALANVAFMVAEESRRLPKEDTLTIVPGFIGSYPNFFFNVGREELDDFYHSIKNARTKVEKEAFYSKFGIRLTNREIWPYADWFNMQYKIYRGLEAGIFDMSRYNNL